MYVRHIVFATHLKTPSKFFINIWNGILFVSYIYWQRDIYVYICNMPTYIFVIIYIYISNSHLFLLWLSNVLSWWLVWRQTKRSPRYVLASILEITYRTALKNRRLTRQTQYLTRFLCCFCFRVFPISRFCVCFGWPEKTSTLSENQNFGKPICGEAKVSLSDLPKCLQP